MRRDPPEVTGVPGADDQDDRTVPREVVSLLTTQEARDLTAPPAGTWPVQFTVWLSSARGDT